MTATREPDTALSVARAQPPGPKLPVLAQSLLFGAFRHRWLPHNRAKYGPTFTVRIAPKRRRMVVISRPEEIKRAFAASTSVLHAGEGNAILGPIMGDHSVLLLDESAHLRVRKLLIPAFHGAPLRGYREVIAELTKAELETWQTGAPVQLHPRMQALTLEIILQVVFGVTDEQRLAELRPVVERVVNVGPIILVGWFYPQLRKVGPWRKFMAIQQTLDRLLYAEIAERRTAPDLATRTDVLSQLLRLSQDDAGPDAVGGLTDPELRDNLITLLLAGHETTATALAWTFHELARNVGELRTAQQAADAGDEPYLDAVFKESMRLHPIIYEVARKVTEPFEIGGYAVAKGATIMPAIGLVQSDPAYFPNPDRFDPRRFVDKQPAVNTWIPFGGGARRCLGAGLATLEATVVLAEVLSRFNLSADPSRPESPKARNITLAPAKGATVVLSDRRG